MNNKPALMNSISNFFDDKNKWKNNNNLNILLVNSKNFKSEDLVESYFFNKDFLNFRLIDTEYAKQFLNLIKSTSKRTAYYNDSGYGHFSIDYGPDSDMRIYSSPYITTTYNGSGSSPLESCWKSAYDTFSPSLNPLIEIDYEIIKKSFNEFSKKVMSKEIFVTDDFPNASPREFRLSSPDGNFYRTI